MKLKKLISEIGKTNIPKKYPNAAQFVTGIVGAARSQFFNPCKLSENHKFACPMRKYLCDILKPFRQSKCPITKDIADMIHGNNVYQDLLDQPIKKESIKGFFWQLRNIENLMNKAYECESEKVNELANVIFKSHDYLSHAFRKDGQEAGFYLHAIGKYQESIKHYLIETFKLPSINNGNEPQACFLDENKTAKLK